MKTIHKYRLGSVPGAPIMLRRGATILHVGADPGGGAAVWALIETAEPLVPVKFCVIGTGAPLEADCPIHVGTLVMPPYVWHVFRGEIG